MKTLPAFSRLAYLSAVLATSVALTTSVASGKSNSSNGGNAGASPHFVVKPINVKKERDHDDRHWDWKDKKHAEKIKKHCAKIIVPTADCPVSPKDPTNSVPAPTFLKSAPSKGPSPGFTSATITNGVLTSAIFNGKGLTVTSNSPGTLTVSNGTNSVTLPGGSLTLHGAPTVSVPAGYQLVRHANGDVTVAMSPVLATGPANLRPDPPGVGLTDNLKSAGGVMSLGVTLPTIAGATIVMTVPAAVVGVASGDVKGALDDVGKFMTDGYDWALGWL